MNIYSKWYQNRFENGIKIDSKMVSKSMQKWSQNRSKIDEFGGLFGGPVGASKRDLKSEDLCSGITTFGNPVLASEREARSNVYVWHALS